LIEINYLLKYKIEILKNNFNMNFKFIIIL